MDKILAIVTDSTFYSLIEVLHCSRVQQLQWNNSDGGSDDKVSDPDHVITDV